MEADTPMRPVLDGLTAAEVDERTRAGRTNEDPSRASRSVGDIVRGNVFTFFNGLLLVLLVAILVYGSPKDALFGFVLVFNVAIGIAQELSAKRTLDRVSLLAAPRVRAVRDGAVIEIPIEAVVADDVVELGPGDQVVADGTVLASGGLEVDESLLTGESHPVVKAVGDGLLSGSFCVAGTGRMQATRVGAESYARELAAQAKVHRPVPSDLRRGTNRILEGITIALVPMAILLIATRWPMTHDLHALVPETVAALVGMIPQGLVLLTSVAFAVSVTKLARRNALIQQLPAVEVLARVDVLCVDKTGTLTDAALELQLVETVVAAGRDEAQARAAIGALAALEPDHARNATAVALSAAFPAPAWAAVERVPFSSGRKWSGADFGEHGAWVMGAPDVLLPPGDATRVRASELAATGARVMLLARAAGPLDAQGDLPALRPALLAVLGERIRDDAAQTLAYFRDQGVTVKVISGDAPETAAWVAQRCGLAVVGEPLDASSLPEDVRALADLLETHTVFGRVKPDQKRAMVLALQSRGHVVAMTGDGVNDTLALKAADLGIAMGSGTAAAKAVALLVLLDSRFATLPGVVAEGRRVIANIERVANLFVTKTVYAALLALAAAVLAVSYPLLPRHFTLVDALTIGIPGFFLALAPMAPRYRPGFLGRVLRFTAVTGLAAGSATLVAYAWALRVVHEAPALGAADAKAAAVTVLVLVGLWVLALLSMPWTRGRIALIAAMLVGFVAVLAVPPIRDFFAMPIPPQGAWWAIALTTLGAVAAIQIGLRLIGWRSMRDG